MSRASLRELAAQARSSRLKAFASIVAIVIAVDMLVTAAVFVEHRHDPLMPHFVRADLASSSFSVRPYQPVPTQLGFSVTAPGASRVTAAGHVIFRNGENPDAVLGYVLAALDKYDETGDARWRSRAEVAAQQVLDTADEGLIPHYNSAYDSAGVPVDTPWFGADTQGLALSVLARLYDVTTDPSWRTPSHAIFDKLVSFRGFFSRGRPAPEHWLASVDSSGYLWFDSFSRGLESSRVLGLQLTAALGLYDFRRALAVTPSDRRKAIRLLGGSVATMTHYFTYFRSPGIVSLAGLAASNRDVRAHFVTVSRMTLLARAVGSARLAADAQELDRDGAFPFFRTAPLQIRAPDLDVYRPTPERVAIWEGSETAPRVTYTGGVSPRGDNISPSLSCRFALAMISKYRDTGDRIYLRRAERAAREVLDTSQKGAIPHQFEGRDDADHPLSPPWYSAGAQGIMLSVLVRLHELTDDPQWRRDADLVFTALTTVRGEVPNAQAPWISLVDVAGYLRFDINAARGAPPADVDVQLTATLGVYDYWRMRRTDRALQFFLGGVATVRDTLALVRNPGGPARNNLVSFNPDPAQHEVITAGVDALGRITGDRKLDRFAELMRSDYP